MNEESLFIAALERPTPEARRAFLEEACGADAALRQRRRTYANRRRGDC